MPLNYEQIDRCLIEAERELLRVGEQRCERLTQNSQLLAVILLLLRCASLLRSMTQLYRSEDLDAFDAVRRALLETWNLAFQFRMQNQVRQVGMWLARRPDSWSAALRDLEEYARNRGHQAPGLGQLYGNLSNLAHPTRDAAENSVALTLKRLAIPNADDHTLAEALANFEGKSSALLYRLLWLVLDQDAALVPLHINEQNMPEAVAFVAELSPSQTRAP